MKRGRGLDRAVPQIPRAELDNLSTGALLARLKRLRWCEEAPDASDLSQAEIASVAEVILFKSGAEWRTAYADVKAVLAEREHLANKS